MPVFLFDPYSHFADNAIDIAREKTDRPVLSKTFKGDEHQKIIDAV